MYFRFYTPLANNLEAHYIHAHISLILVPDVNMIGHPVLSNSFSYFFYCKIFVFASTRIKNLLVYDFFNMIKNNVVFSVICFFLIYSVFINK